MNVNEICRHLDAFNEELRVCRQRFAKANDRIAPSDVPPKASSGNVPVNKTDSGIFTHDVNNMLERMNGYIADLRDELARYESFTLTNPPAVAADICQMNTHPGLTKLVADALPR